VALEQETVKLGREERRQAELNAAADASTDQRTAGGQLAVRKPRDVARYLGIRRPRYPAGLG
jgi:hypothetical protein